MSDFYVGPQWAQRVQTHASPTGVVEFPIGGKANLASLSGQSFPKDFG